MRQIEACKKGDVRQVEMLVKQVNLETSDDSSQTPLHWACGDGHFDVVNLLIEKEADKKAKNKIGRTLCFAFWHGQLDVV